MNKRKLAAQTLLAAIVLAAIAKAAGYDIGLEYALNFLMETEQ
jgi:hypothetical protein